MALLWDQFLQHSKDGRSGLLLERQRQRGGHGRLLRVREGPRRVGGNGRTLGGAQEARPAVSVREVWPARGGTDGGGDDRPAGGDHEGAPPKWVQHDEGRAEGVHREEAERNAEAAGQELILEGNLLRALFS
uniref:(northern house mosquito) hypothetical protein n=1 Tax=Culex pipiens TaxID=7175 RepID=A0A8D8K2H1_CULPI